MTSEAPPPPPPPHGQSPRPPGGLPDGNYDIFIIPPHSAGSGFLYLPSLQPHRNSFLAGVACTVFAIGLWSLVVPVLRQWYALIMSGGGGVGMFGLVAAVGVGAWAIGKTQAENTGGPRPPGGGGAGPTPNASYNQQHYAGGPPPNHHSSAPPPSQPEQEYHQHTGYAPPPPPEPEPQARSNPAADHWQKAREETRKREEERKKAEELKRKREEAQKAREEAERAAKAKAEKEKWEQARAREKETREREARERIVRERIAREREAKEKLEKEKAAAEKAEKDKLEREKLVRERVERLKADREKKERERAEQAAAGRTSPSKGYQQPSARSHVGTEDEHSYRPYETPRSKAYTSGASSVSGHSEGSYAASQSTARTTPPPSHRGPYSTNDPDKIQIRAVYLFSDNFPTKPIAQLVSNQGAVTDGLVLHIKTEGLFIDDDVRGVAQREWDVKAWTLKLVENGKIKTAGGLAAHGLHIFRATVRDSENKKYTFILDETEAWKVDAGLSRLKKGSQVRQLNMSNLKDAEMKLILMNLGWIG